MRVTFIVPGSFTLSHGSAPDAPPTRREAFYLEAIGTSLSVQTIFEPIAGKSAGG